MNMITQQIKTNNQSEYSTERLTYTIREVQKLLGLGRQTAYNAVQSGAIPVIKIGKRLLVPRSALHSLLAAPPASAKPAEPVELPGPGRPRKVTRLTDPVGDDQ
jgi:excisionase family DNA binding protein